MINDRQKKMLDELEKVRAPYKKMSESFPFLNSPAYIDLQRKLSFLNKAPVYDSSNNLKSMRNDDGSSLNHVISSFLMVVKEHDIFDIRSYNSASLGLELAYNDGYNFIDAYEYLYVQAEYAFKVAINDKIDNVFLNIEVVNFNDHIELVQKIKSESGYLGLKLSDSELDKLAIYFNLASINHECAPSLLSAIKEDILKRVFVIPYKDLLINFIRENTAFIVPEKKYQDQKAKKSGVNNINKPVYEEVLRITDATLKEFPNVSTYALVAKFTKHFSGKNTASSNTLRRWITQHREKTGQKAKGKHTGKFHLIVG
ncbi:hypothetical protein IO679_001573 [Salmonella enterica subsp. enterica serovar Glostrup]|nr:hypothetical protein [Salmonella enterica subsp. enterica serovar Glostrup]